MGMLGRLSGTSRVYKARQVRDLAHLHELNDRATEDVQEIDVVGVVVGMNGPEIRAYKSGRPYLFTSVRFISFCVGLNSSCTQLSVNAADLPH